MSTRYDDRDEERGRRNYGRRSGQDYDRSYGQSSQSGFGSAFDDEGQRYAGESRWRGQYGTGRNLYRGGGDYQSRDWGSEGWQDDREYSSERDRTYGGAGGRGGYSGGGYGGTSYGDEYGSSYGAGSERGEARYRDTSGSRSQRSTYAGGYRSGESYGERGRGYSDYGRGGYAGEYGRRGYGQERRYEDRGGYEGRGGYGEGEDRGWWDRFSDTVASWFGDEEAERRRRMERPYRGRGPKGYRRSDERIKEDINDRLSEGYLDATEIEVTVTSAEVVLSGTVDSRADKRRAEAIAENVSGVMNVENRLRVKDRQQFGTGYGTSQGLGMSSTGTTDTGATGTGTGASAASAGGAGSSGATGTTGTARGKTASS
jgi:osmotically-inducible protein OsmY